MVEFAKDVLIPVAAVLAAAAVAICLHMLNRARADLADPKTREDKLAELLLPGFVATYRGWLAAVLDRLDRWFGERLFFQWRGVWLCAGIAVAYAFVFFVAGWGFGGPGGLGPVGFLGKIVDPAARGGIAGALVASLAALGLVAWKQEVIDAWFWARARRLLPRGWPEWLVGGVVAVVFGVSAFGVLYGLLGLDGYSAGVFAFLLAITAYAGAFAVTFVFILAIVAVAAAFAPAVVGTVAFAVAFAVTFAFFLAIAGARFFVLAGLVAFSLALRGGVWNPGFLVIVLFFFLLPIANGFLDYLSLSVSRRLGRRLLGKGAIRIRIILGHTVIDLAAAAVLLAALAFVVPWAIQSFNLVVPWVVQSIIPWVVQHSNLIVGPLEDGELLPLKPLLARVSADDATFGDHLWVGGMLFSTLVPTAAHLAMLWTGLFALGSRWRRRTIKILQKPAKPDPGYASAAELTVAARYLVLRWAEGALAAVLTIMALVFFYGLAGSMAEHLVWVAERGIAFAEILFD